MPTRAYLKMPLMIAAKKPTTPKNSNPVIIFLFRVTLRGRRRRSNLEDRIHPTLSVPERNASRRSIDATRSSMTIADRTCRHSGNLSEGVR